MKPSEKIKQEIETLLEEMKELGYKVIYNDEFYKVHHKIYTDLHICRFSLNQETTLAQLDEIIENLLKLKVRV
jgi:hypothetical protein